MKHLNSNLKPAAEAVALSSVGLVSTGTVCTDKLVPMSGTTKLAGSASAMMDAVATFRHEVLDAMQESTVVASDGQAQVKALFQCFHNADADTIDDALNLKKSGFAQGSTPYVQLSIVRGLYQTFHKVGGHAEAMLTTDTVIYTNKAGEKVESGSFKARTALARILLNEWKARQAEIAIDAKAYGEAKGCLPEDADKVDVIAAAEQIAEEIRENAKLEAQAEIEAASTPEAWAEKVAKSLYRQHGYDTTSNIINLLPAALIHAEHEALEKAAKIAKAKLDAAK